MKVKGVSPLEFVLATTVFIITMFLAINFYFNESSNISNLIVKQSFTNTYYNVKCFLPFCVLPNSSVCVNSTNCFTYLDYLIILSNLTCQPCGNNFTLLSTDLGFNSNKAYNSNLTISYDDDGVKFEGLEGELLLGDFNNIKIVYNTTLLLNYSEHLLFLPSYKKSMFIYDAFDLSFNLSNDYTHFKDDKTSDLINPGVYQTISSYFCLYNSSSSICFVGYNEYSLFNNSYYLYLSVDTEFLYITYDLNEVNNKDAIVAFDKVSYS